MKKGKVEHPYKTNIIGIDVQKDMIYTSLPTPRKPYPLTKKIGLAVLAITECMVVSVFAWSAYTKQLQEAFDVVGYQMIIFAAFWGVKAIADNIKSVREKE